MTSDTNLPYKHIDFYQLFLNELKHISQTPVSAADIALKLGLKKSQVEDWLRVAVESHFAKKLLKPVRYQWDASFLEKPKSQNTA